MKLERFVRELSHHKGEIGHVQYWRYKGGRLPRLLVWLVENPDLAQALAQDAVDLAQEKTKREAA